MKLPMINVVPSSDKTEHTRSVSSMASSCQLLKESGVATVADIVAPPTPRRHSR